MCRSRGSRAPANDTVSDVLTQYDYFGALRPALSADRWNTYRTTPTEAEHVVAGRYAWNLALAEALYPALHAVEVALRNRVFDAIASVHPVVAYTDVNCWLDARPNVLYPRERARVGAAKHTLRLALRRKYATKALVKAHLTPGRLIAELAFGFWTYLFSSAYGAGPGRPGRLWPQLLPSVFPSLPSGTQRAAIERRLNAVRELRNRVFHHEPIWQRADLDAEYDGILELCSWLSPELANGVRALDRFRAVHSAGVRRYLRRGAFVLGTSAKVGAPEGNSPVASNRDS